MDTLQLDTISTTISAIRQEKQKLENEITTLLNNFTIKTGMQIDDIHYRNITNSYISGKKQYIMAIVKIDIGL